MFHRYIFIDCINRCTCSYHGLQAKSKRVLLESLPILIRTVSISKLTTYLNQQVLELFRRHDTTASSHDYALTALWSLVAAVKVNDPPQNVTLLLFQTIEELYKLPAMLGSVSCVGCCFHYSMPVGVS